MTPEIDVTGERFIPEAMGGQLIEAEHQARYRLAASAVRGRSVLDAGCGVGWGSALLLDLGARSVVGVDIADEALRSARDREVRVRFEKADICSLPFEEATFDVVVCFEALEHVPEPLKALDEFARVLVPGGVLLASSPNPALYPAGNPFHVRELTPTELHEAAAERFANVQLWYQVGLLASGLFPNGSPRRHEQWPALGTSVSEIGLERAMYSLVVASDSPLPDFAPVVALCPSDQLDHLATASEALEQERTQVREDHARIAAERERMLAERKELLARVQVAEKAAREHVQVAQVMRTHAPESHRVERDHLAARLLDAEQRVAGLTRDLELLRQVLERK